MFRTPIADALAEGLKIQSADETILRMAQTIAALRARVAEMERLGNAMADSAIGVDEAIAWRKAVRG